MNKRRIVLFSFIVLVLAIVGGIIGFIVTKNNNSKIDTELELSEKVTDECTEEYLQMAKEDTETANAEDEKVSPNATLILKKYYKKCKHSIEDKIELPKELINKTKEELQNEYSKWEIEEFSAEKIILKQEYDEECGEHYVLRDNMGIIAIYKVNEKGEESLLDETEIATEYLTQEDLQKIQEGFYINGREELNKILEDFE